MTVYSLFDCNRAYIVVVVNRKGLPIDLWKANIYCFETVRTIIWLSCHLCIGLITSVELLWFVCTCIMMHNSLCALYFNDCYITLYNWLSYRMHNICCNFSKSPNQFVFILVFDVKRIVSWDSVSCFIARLPQVAVFYWLSALLLFLTVVVAVSQHLTSEQEYKLYCKNYANEHCFCNVTW